MTLTLRPFQKDGVKFLLSKTRALLRDHPGLGKTVQNIVAVNVLQTDRNLKSGKNVPLNVLVISPKSVTISWKREVEKWSNGGTNWKIINHDRLITKDFKELSRNIWDVIIADESHQYLKNINCQRAKAFFVLNDTAKTVWLSTATPASKSAEDYYATFKILLPELFKNVSKSKFIATYCERVKDNWCHSGFKYVGFKDEAALNKILSACSIGRKQDEVASDLPELTYTDYYADVSKKDLQHFAEDDIEYLKRSIRSGVEPTEHNEALKENARLKIPSVVELLNSYPSDVKVVIFAWHRDVVHEMKDAVLKETDRECEFITGEVSDAEKRQAIIDRFQTGSLNTLVLNMQSGGVGITLTAATKGIYLQFPYSTIHWRQSQKRIHRIGSSKPVQIIKVMIEKGIDEEIFSELDTAIGKLDQIEG